MRQGYPTAIALVGAGIMGEALLSAMIASGISPESITISEKREERAHELRARYGINIADLQANVSNADAVLLVVKPQDMSALLTEIQPYVAPSALLISFAAGKKIDFVLQHVGAQISVIRVMPNTPALVGAGMAAMSLGPNVSEAQRDFVRDFLEATGRVIEVREELQDAVTAVSGSGPAYFFAFVEAMISAGESLGLSHEVSTELTVQTIIGAATLLAKSEKSPTVLRENVTSPNGTTAAALASFSKSGMDEMVKRAMTAARDRSQELA